ncbi:hypothetical protein NJ7G_0785 [Natrinema sp. J7-2]|nr:hypothetical protein NJ7G_0785 [Natrinema sp. J7-2]
MSAPVPVRQEHRRVARDGGLETGYLARAVRIGHLFHPAH